MMNDTFDNLTFSNITTTNLENQKSVLISTNQLNNKKDFTANEKEIEKKNKNDISFDDSLFLNSQEFTILRNAENKDKSDKNHTSQESILNEKNNSLISDFFDQPSFDNSGISSQKSKNNENVSHITNSALESNETFPNNEKNTSINDIFDTPSFTEDTNNTQNCTTLTNGPPSAELNPKMLELSSWGLPEAVLEKYSSRNIISMFPWQVECLNNPKVLKQHSNLVYSAPTSAGKTLVAEILAIKTVLERSKKVIFILPFVSVVREKMFYFQEIFSGSGVRVEGFMGSYNPPGGFQSVQFAVCTIEKANSLINHFLQEGTLSEIGAVIIDEMHLLGEPNRGYILELLLTKLRYVSLKDSGVDIQIIGMSATLPNLTTLSKWLDAELYVTNFRPIPLYEQALVAGAVYDTGFERIRQIQPIPDLETDTDHILQLCLETIKDNCSVLIFCPTKNWCENLAQQISTAFYKLGRGQSHLSLELRQQLKTDRISELLEQLKCCPVGLDGVLRVTVSFGVAFHHAGLTLDERDIIEGAFRNGTIRVLVATSTLSSGVNLPARRVIIRTPVFHGKPLDALTYRQMIGRAGRMGKDTSGESILVCQKNEEKFARSLMCEQLKPIESCLEGEGKLKRAILEIVASGVASTPDDVQLFTKCTLLAQNDTFDNPIDEALEFLVNNEFLRLQDTNYTATSLGKACLSSSIPPEDGLALFTELGKARQCFVLETELHLIYLVTPYSACHQWGNIDWMFYLNLWEKLPSSMKKVGELVGVRESYIVCATRGKLQTNTSKLYHKFLVHKRFFVALALQDLVNEKPLSEVCCKFSCNRGMLQTLQLTASTFAGMVTSFSKQLGWSTVEILISQFQDRLHFGVSRDLLDLMKLPILNGKSARALFNGGLESLVQIANSDVDTIENILHRVVPFESGKIREGESEFALKERNKLKTIWITGKEGLTEREAAELLLKSARDYLRIEMGLKEAKWDDSDSSSVEGSQSEEKENVSLSQNLFSPLKEQTPSKFNATSDGSLFESSITEETPKLRNTSTISLNSSGDFIATSQDESISFRTPILPRKRPRRGKENYLPCESPRKKMKSFENFEEIEIVDVCSSENLFFTFCREAKTQQKFSLAVACTEVQEKKRTIGLTPNTPSEDKYVYKNMKVEGFALCWDKRTSYYLNVTKIEKCIDFLKSLLSKQLTVTIFDSKEQIKVLKRCCGVDFGAKVEDPKIADWLLEPEGREKSLQAMVNVYCPGLSKVVQLCGVTRSRGSPSLDLRNEVEPKLCSSVEALLCCYLSEAVKEELQNQSPQLARVFDTEMSCVNILAQMELTGLPTNKSTLIKLVHTLNHKQQDLEKKAYALAGRRFSFASTKEVAKILGLYTGRKVSTKKQILEKNENPISDLVLQWRKINCTITKLVQPLLRSVDHERIHGCCVVHTATGRITMHEPNLQNVTKNFDIEGMKISCRDAFVAEEGNVFVSADYCQLELRLLAHLSKDEVLCGIMRGGGDVFRSVAAKWNNLKESEVTDDLRQSAKQICYGIIYGMGSKTLSEQLSVDEKQASIFMDTFRNAYPGVKNYIKEVIDTCRKNGFVETLAGRRRYLAHINHRSLSIRSQAERQAVNTTIQGSAADIVKSTMVVLDQKLHSMKDRPKLVLHLHDELLFQTSRHSLSMFAAILKRTMEESVKLSIPFPVKVKVGPSWGQLTEYNV